MPAEGRDVVPGGDEARLESVGKLSGRDGKGETFIDGKGW